MRKGWKYVGATLVAAVGLSTVAARTSDETAPSVSLEWIRALEGEWVKVDEEGKPTDEVSSSIRSTAGGSAVMELLFPGTEHEMLTVYHQDGPDLLLTHYCVKGNQPRMRASATDEGEALVFECLGGTNMVEDDAHMHDATLRRVGKDRLRAEWRMFEKGEHTYTAEFDLARRP